MHIVAIVIGSALFLMAVQTLIRTVQRRYETELPNPLVTPWLFAQGSLKKIK